jgi:chorismate mutase
MVTRVEGAVRVRAIRGATTVACDDPALIADAVREMLRTIVAENDVVTDDIVSAMFTLTPDLHSVFPAAAARSMGWHDVPMMCASEIDVAGAQPRCIRVMLHVERAPTARPVTHVYLREAVALRPDLCRDARSREAREDETQERETLAVVGAAL